MKSLFVRVSIASLLLGILFGKTAGVTAIGCALETKKPYKIGTSNSIWYISENCTKRPIRTPAVFFSHFTSWRDVRTVSPSVLNAIPSDPLSFLPWGPRRVFENGSLVKTVDDPTVYLLVNGIRYTIQNESTMALYGLEFGWVEDVFPEALEKYALKQKSLETLLDIPAGVQVVVKNDPTVYSVNHISSTSTIVTGIPQRTMEDVRRVYRADRIFRLPVGTRIGSGQRNEPDITHLANVSLPTRDCSGSVFQMNGMWENQKALVLTNGHCSGLGSYLGTYPDDGEIFLNTKAPGIAILRKDKMGGGDVVSYNNILFASMTKTDLAIIELDTTYEQIRELGYQVFYIAKNAPVEHSLLRFDSYNRDVDSMCLVERIIPQVKEGPWTWNNVFRLTAERGCTFVPGQSGTPGVPPSGNSIYAVANTAYEGGEACTLNNPCEFNLQTQKASTGALLQGYAVPVTGLYDCYDETKHVFDFTVSTCSLARPN